MNSRFFIVPLIFTSALVQGQPPDEIVKLDPRNPPTIDASDKCDDLVIESALPDWPKEALRKGTSGWTIVRYELGTNGKAQNVTVESAAPTQVFDRSSVSAVERSRFKSGVSRTGCKMLLTWSLR